jgi:hypothetical protein
VRRGGIVEGVESMLKPLIIAALALTAASPAIAEATPAAKAKDPNRKICEKIERIGSRLAVDRICMTAAEWEAQKRAQREHVEDVQRTVNQRPTQ